MRIIAHFGDHGLVEMTRGLALSHGFAHDLRRRLPPAPSGRWSFGEILRILRRGTYGTGDSHAVP
jgi:hypothetical protein